MPTSPLQRGVKALSVIFQLYFLILCGFYSRLKEVVDSEAVLVSRSRDDVLNMAKSIKQSKHTPFSLQIDKQHLPTQWIVRIVHQGIKAKHPVTASAGANKVTGKGQSMMGAQRNTVFINSSVSLTAMTHLRLSLLPWCWPLNTLIHGAPQHNCISWDSHCCRKWWHDDDRSVCRQQVALSLQFTFKTTFFKHFSYLWRSMTLLKWPAVESVQPVKQGYWCLFELETRKPIILQKNQNKNEKLG